MCHFSVLLYKDLNKQHDFPLSKGRSINNIILGRRVEVVITASVSYGYKSCQEHKVRGCISATSKGRATFMPNARCINRLDRAEIRYYSRSECALSGKVMWCYHSLQQITTAFELIAVAGPLVIFIFWFIEWLSINGADDNITHPRRLLFIFPKSWGSHGLRALNQVLMKVWAGE